ncbi:MAG: hypothetical protein ACLFPQ_02555 [Candidatus Woesearchaeota archaeon]
MVILFDRFNLPEDVYEIIFATNQQKIVGKLLMGDMKENGGEMTKTQMSLFATQLHEGNLITEIDEPGYVGKKVKISYNKRQFYDRILTPMKSMGLIDYDLYKKTYKISDNFNKALIKIGLMWTREIRKDVKELNVKRKDNSFITTLDDD